MEEKQKEIVLELLKDFQEEPIVTNQGKKQNFKEFDEERYETLKEVREYLNSFFNEKLNLEDFKIKVDSLNKKKPYWGFRGINGQMFFNMLYKSSPNKNKLTENLRTWLKSPENIESAKKKINDFLEYVKIVSTEKDGRKNPKSKSIIYFLSYFWQIQEPEKYPIFYNSLEQIFIELNILNGNEDLANYYQDFYDLNNKLKELFSKDKEIVNFWYVEHVFWKSFIKEELEKKIESKIKDVPIKKEKVSEYIPPIISDIISLSLNESNPADFEKKTATLFSMLGFDVELLGQGKGRTVDIISRAWSEKPYVLLIDCKARSKKDFKLNSGEERTIIEYIKSFMYEYPKESGFEKHYLIVSSGFKNDDENIRRKIKAETNVDISFIDIETLLFLLTKQLQNWDFNVERMREIFQIEGLITKDIIQDTSSGR